MDLDEKKYKMHFCKTYRNISKPELYKKIAILRDLLDIKLDDYPLNVAKLEQRLNDFVFIERVTFETPKLCGFLIKKDLPTKSIIIINSKLSREDYFFALAHETVHYFCHNETSESMNNPLLFTEHTENEKQANEGAAELILPHRVFIEDYFIGLNVYKNHDATIKNTAKAYGVNEQVAIFRFKNLSEIIEKYNRNAEFTEGHNYEV